MPLIKYCMSAEVWEEEDWPNEPYHDFLQRCMDYQRNLQPFKKSKATWGILDRSYQKNGWKSTCVINDDRTTWENLQLFIKAHESNPFSSLIDCIDRTKILMGRRVLESWIAHPKPKGEICQVKMRQHVVECLLNDEQLFDELDKQLSLLKESENFFLSFWLNDPLLNACSKSYFESLGENINAKMNSSSFVLGTSEVWSHFKRASQCISAISGRCV